jgi:tetratricopeptide (TPR) repeat protein
MITQLGRINPARLGVIARTSSMTYKSTDKTIEQIGRELGVSHVLEGSARRAGGRVRIAAQLIQVSDQTHLWAESYEADLKDILNLQSKVSQTVAKQIRIKLLPSESRASEEKEVNPVAYEAYLQGRYLWNRRTEHDLRTSVRYFEEAVRADPSFAYAYCGMADSYLTLMDHGYLSPQEATAKARELIERAFELDESLAAAHATLAHTALHEFDWTTAEREFARGTELNPNYPSARHCHSNFLAAMGRMEEAVIEAEHARELDPVSPSEQSNLASILWLSGKYERAIEAAEKALEMNPSYAGAYEDLGRVHEQIGNLDAAIEAFQKAASLAGHSQGSLASLGHAYAVAGKTEEATAILSQLHEVAKVNFVSSYNFALVLVGLGRTDEAFSWFDKAFEERSPALPFLKVNPRLSSLHGDPRFQNLLHRVGLT